MPLHTLFICNTVSMVTKMYLNVAFIHTSPVHFVQRFHYHFKLHKHKKNFKMAV
jgi:hypothetical protein